MKWRSLDESSPALDVRPLREILAERDVAIASCPVPSCEFRPAVNQRGKRLVFRPIVCLVFIAVIAISLCAAQSRDPFRSTMTYELYSWPDSKGDWNFSILINTDAQTRVAQVFDERVQIHGVSQIEKKLSLLVPGSRIYWLDRIPRGGAPREKGSESLTLPPQKIREEIRHFGAKHHIEIGFYL